MPLQIEWLKPMSQKKDRAEYVKRAALNHWQKCHEQFFNSDECKKAHQVLMDYGIKEPYATNIIERLFVQAYKIIY